MFDSEHHWFYGAKRASAYATAERLQQELWWYKLSETHVSCVRAELPYLFQGYWQGHLFEVEFEPRKSLVCRSDAELPPVIVALTQSLRRGPSFRYQDQQDCNVFEWWGEGKEARWQAMQGQPVFKQLERLGSKR